MAEPVTSSVGPTIGKLLIDEAKFLWGVEGQVKDLLKELNLIQSLLRDADARCEHDRAVGEWVAQLRDIAYDAEDVIEQYILGVAPKKELNIVKVYGGFVAKCMCLQAPEYHVTNILTAILVELIPDQREGVMHMRDDELFDTLYKIQQEKRCIMVLDYIWTKKAWDNLHDSFPVENTRSKLLIMTCNKDVAEYIDPHGLFHELQCLSDLESWDLLKKRVFPKTKVITEDMKRLGDELLKKCAGLPLAVTMLGGLLAVNEWETIYKNINSHFSDKSDVSKVLALSYEDLPWHLKPCFLYLGSFLDDAKILATKKSPSRVITTDKGRISHGLKLRRSSIVPINPIDLRIGDHCPPHRCSSRRRSHIASEADMSDIVAAGGGAPPAAFGADTDLLRARSYMQEKIFVLLAQRHHRPLTDTQKQKLNDIVKRLEDGLFKSAHSKDEYMNLSTLESCPGLSHNGSSTMMRKNRRRKT
ncbi:hypothetical protein NL676_009980 [Syzygium grande]|nr:hypothetical protein NL676_009980 [Syzygium grande]